MSFALMFKPKSAAVRESKQPQELKPEETHCFIEFHSKDNEAFPIHDVFKEGVRNKLMSEQAKGQHLTIKFYQSIDAAAKDLIGITRPGNHKAGYIVELGVDAEQAKDLIKEEKLNLIIIRAINSYDLAMNKIVPTHKIEELKNENFKPELCQKQLKPLQKENVAQAPTP